MAGQTRTMPDGYAAGGRSRETVIGHSNGTTARSATYRYIPRYTLAAKGPISAQYVLAEAAIGWWLLLHTRT